MRGRVETSSLRLGLLLVVGLALRLGWVVMQGASVEDLPDQAEYLALGRNLAAGQGLWFHDERFDDTVYAFRTPGYPALIAALAGSIPAVRIAQAFVDTLTILATYLLARRWLDRNPSLVAAAVTAFNPFLIYFTGLLLTETLFTALLAWSMLLVARGAWREKGIGWGWLLAGALLLATSSLVRPSGILLAPAVVAGAVLLNPHRRWAYGLVATVLSVGLTLAVLWPWAYRNERLLDAWVWTTTNSGITAYDGFSPWATGASNQAVFLSRMHYLNWMDEVERDAYLRQLARQWAAENPADSVRLGLVKIARTWSPIPLSQDYARPLYIAVGILFFLPLYALLLLGLWRGNLSRSAKAFLVIPAIYVTVVHALSVGSLRYRVPVEPVLAVLAGAGAHRVARSVDLTRARATE